ncbi:MAG: flagellar hook-length control protein FliK [Treponema sp.]|nr:flagellar hook-length control protein FliK [Treponema sp.]
MQAQLTNQTDLLSLQALNQNVSFSNVVDSMPKELSFETGNKQKVSFEQAIEKARNEDEAAVHDEDFSEKTEAFDKTEKTVSKNEAPVEKTERALSEKKDMVEKILLREELPASQKMVLSKKTDIKNTENKEKGQKQTGRNIHSKKVMDEKKSEKEQDFPKILIMGSHGEQNEKPALDEKIKGQEKSLDTNVSVVSNEIAIEKSIFVDSDKGFGEQKLYLDKDKKIQVHDLRTKETFADEKNQLISQNSGEKPLKVTQTKFEGNHAELTFDLNQNQNTQAIQNNILSSNDQTARANGSSFQAMLTNQLQESAGDIVKAGSIVLKDNDIGSIKLVLHPEALGDVKIDLQLNDKVISGKIVVSSQEAYNAFKDSAENLRQSFNESGFDTKGFELSMSNGGSSSSNQQGFENHEPRNYSHFDVELSYGEENFDGDFETVNNFEISMKNGVNIVA